MVSALLKTRLHIRRQGLLDGKKVEEGEADKRDSDTEMRVMMRVMKDIFNSDSEEERKGLKRDFC